MKGDQLDTKEKKKLRTNNKNRSKTESSTTKDITVFSLKQSDLLFNQIYKL